MKKNDIKLLSCPFCGGKPFVYTTGNTSCGFFAEIICKNCGCRTGRVAEKTASDVWNTRKPIEHIVEQLKNETDCPNCSMYCMDANMCGFDEMRKQAINIVRDSLEE